MPSSCKLVAHALGWALFSQAGSSCRACSRELHMQNSCWRCKHTLSESCWMRNVHRGGRARSGTAGLPVRLHLMPEHSEYGQDLLGTKFAHMQVIRGLLDARKYVVVVVHDLAVLDYPSDCICCCLASQAG